MILGIVGPLQIVFLLLLIVGTLLIAIFFNLTLQKSMAAVSSRNQSIAPGLIWLNFIPIPLLNSVWTMIFGIATCSAMNKDAGEKIAPSTLAVVYPSISIFNSILALIMNASMGYRGPNIVLAVLVGILSITSFILWIVFWSQLSTAKNKLEGISHRSGVDDNLDSGLAQKPSSINQDDRKSQEIKSSKEKDNLDSLVKYKELMDNGVITQEEFDKKKKELLG